jgi:hypothetical protein
MITHRGIRISREPADPRIISDSPSDERGTGGQTRLARLLGWSDLTFWRKLNDKSRITQSDELAIEQALAMLQVSCRDKQ